MNRQKSFGVKVKSYFVNLIFPTNLCDALQLIVFFLSWTEIPSFRRMSPARTIGDCSHKLSVLFGRLMSFTMLLMFTYCYVLTVMQPVIFTANFDEFPLFQTVDTILVTASMFAMCLVYLSPIWQRYTLSDIIKILILTDDHLERVSGVQPRHQQTVLYLLKRLVSNLFLYALYVAVSVWLFNQHQHKTEFNTWISYFMPHYIISQIVLKKLTMTQLLQDRFANLNKVSSARKLSLLHIQLLAD